MSTKTDSKPKAKGKAKAKATAPATDSTLAQASDTTASAARIKAPRTGSAKKFTPEMIAAALTAAGGLVSLAARNLGSSRETVYQYIATYPEVAAAKTDAREQLIDLAESRLANAVNDGERWAVEFTLKTVGKNRGFSEKVEVVSNSTVQIEDNQKDKVDYGQLARDFATAFDAVVEKSARNRHKQSLDSTRADREASGILGDSAS